MTTVFYHVVRVKGGKLQAVAGVTYPDGVPTCVARADGWLSRNGYAHKVGRTVSADVEKQKNFAGRAVTFAMLEPYA